MPRASGIQNLARELESRFHAELAEQIGDVKLDGFGRVLGVVGCAGNAGPDENVESHSAALSSVDYVDSTGFVHIRVKTCDWIGPTEHDVASCAVDSGFVLVGGGAEVEGSAPGGGLLTHSFPASKSVWVAASKDHVVPYAHRLRAYAVGMALTGMSSTTLSNLVTITSATSAAGHAPSVQVPVPSFNILLSGGAASNYTGAGQLLTGSFPSSDLSSWTASSKDHQVSDIATVTGYVISIPVCLNNALPRCLLVNAQSNSAFVSTGYGVTTANTPVGWVPVGVGGRAEYNFPGRLLTDLIPSNGVGASGATVYSKDHDLVEGNQTDVWALSVQGF